MKGIDVSHWEPVINWQMVRQAGYEFAYIKCSQGNYNDALFSTHWNNAKASGMPRGAFHFFDTAYSPNVQAETFYNAVKNDPGELPWALDIEKYISGMYYGSQYWYDFLEHLKSLSDHPIIIYTGYYYWIENVSKGSHRVQDVNYFAQYPLWISRYKATAPLIPDPWTAYAYWQYSDSELIDGVYDELGRKTECDVNISSGTIISIPTGTVTPMTTVYKFADLKAGYGSNVRTQPTQSASIVKSLSGPLTVSITGDKVTAEGFDWYPIISPNAGYVAMTSSYANLRDAEVGTSVPHTIEVLIDGVSVYKTEV